MPGARSLILVEIGAGELVDKLTILSIKLERIRDPQKLQNVRTEHDLLLAVRNACLTVTDLLSQLETDLRATNERLWFIEENLRQLEKEADFGHEFVRLAREVYRQNDLRAQIKMQINVEAGSRIIEEKSYSVY